MKLPPEIIETARYLAETLTAEQQAHDLRRQGKAHCGSCLYWRMNAEAWERQTRQGDRLPYPGDWGGICQQSPKQGVSKLEREWCGEFRPFAHHANAPSQTLQQALITKRLARALIQQGKAKCKDCLFFEVTYPFSFNYGHCHRLPKTVYIRSQYYYSGEFIPLMIKSKTTPEEIQQ